jgi:hypothetical protein
MLASERQVAALVGLFKGGTKLTYRKGEFIIRPGETPSAVFYIETGLVKAYNITKYGEENSADYPQRSRNLPFDLGYNRPGAGYYLPSHGPDCGLAHQPPGILVLPA